MKKLAFLVLIPVLLLGCGGATDDVAYEAEPEVVAPLIEVETPEPMAVPEAMEVTADDDWAAKTHNKNIEVIQVLNIITPVATYIIAGFEQYGDSFSEVLHEEWADTQVQLGAATTLYDSCKERMAAGENDKKLFLDLEEVWQLLVKTGVAGVRSKSMVDSEVGRLKG
ncbi:MAG: hypothetical protein DRJ65_00705 [Acidobacteria bacterium]|nr:MAG: hypothetical protein DRJ65_00705 [Acidobacteriota bacterium]